MAPFDDALERMERLLRCSLCSEELHSTYTVKECGHHFCQKCIYQVLGTDCVCPTCGIPARVGNLIKNPSYDILVACVTKLRNIRRAQREDPNSNIQKSPPQGVGHDIETGTFIGSPIWTYDCGPTLPNSDHFSSLSNVEAQTFPSIDAAMTIHRREIDIQQKVGKGVDREVQSDQKHLSNRDTKGVLPSQQTEVLSEDSNNLPPQATQQQVPPTISQLQRLLNIRKTTSPTPLPRQESESPPDRSPYYGSQELSTGGASHFNTPQMPTPSFPISLLDLGSQKNSDIDQTQSSCKPSVSIDSSRKRRLQPEECSEQQKAIHDSNGDVNSTKKNKKPLRAFQRHDLYSPDDMIRIRRHQPMNNKKNNKSEMSANDDKRIWSCMFCDKTMNIGRDVHIEECPTCGRSQVKLEVKQEAEEGLPVLNTDSDDDDRQVIQSSQPTLDANMYTLMPYRDQLYPSIDNDSSHSKQLLPSSPPDNSVINHDSSFNIISKSTSNSFKSPVTSRSESHSGHAISCVFTGLSKDQKDAFDDNITRVIEAGLFMEHIPDQVFNESATHIITSIDSSIWKRFGVALCPRVLKYLVAMLSDGWIVRHEWFLDSIKARMWLPLPDVKYLIQGDAQFGPAPGTQYRRELRIQQSYKLFDSCKMFFYGEFGTAAQKSIKKQELLRLVQCGGASVLMKRPPKSSAIRTRSRTPSKHENIQPGSNNHNNNNGADENLFSSTRTFLYLTEEYKPWQVPIDKTAPIIVCDPTKIPSGLISHGSPSSKNGSPSSPSTTTASTTTTLTSVDLKKHGWLRDFQAVSLTWVLNCISCSLMGKADIEMLYGSSNPKEIQELDQAWDSWRANKS